MILSNQVEQLRITTAIRTAAVDVFSTMLGMDILPGETVIRKTAHDNHSGVTAMLGLTGEWVGSGQFSCEPEFACQIASQMLMASYDAVDADVLDAIAEIANMIVGNVKNTLEEWFGPMGLSTPALFFGEAFATRIPGNPDWIVVPFTCGGASMLVQLVLAPSNRYRRCPRPAAVSNLAA